MIIKFKDGNTSKEHHIGLFNLSVHYNNFKGSIKTIEDFIRNTKDITHIGLLKDYGNDNSLVILYPIIEIESIIKN